MQGAVTYTHTHTFVCPPTKICVTGVHTNAVSGRASLIGKALGQLDMHITCSSPERCIDTGMHTHKYTHTLHKFLLIPTWADV